MSKILIAMFAGTLNENGERVLPAFYEYVVSQLKKKNDVFLFMHGMFGDIDFGKPPENLIKQIEEFNPDLCILFNNSFYEIRDIVDCPILIYYVDSVIYTANKSAIKRHPNAYFYIADNESKNILEKEYHVSSQRIKNIAYFSGVRAKKEAKENNIVFIGSKFVSSGPNYLTQFLQEKPSLDEKEEFQRALDCLKEYPFATLEDFVQAGVITSDKVFKYFDIKYFLMALSTEKRINVLDAISGLGLKLYGTSNWISEYFYRSRLSLCFSEKKIYTLEDNERVYNSAKIGISIGHLQAKAAFPWRVLDILNSNACLVSDFHEDFNRVFPKDLFPIYNDEYEARKICEYLLKDEKARLNIVKRSQEFAKTNFDVHTFFEEVEKMISVQLL